MNTKRTTRCDWCGRAAKDGKMLPIDDIQENLRALVSDFLQNKGIQHKHHKTNG